MLKEETIEFFKKIPPFDNLSKIELESVFEDISMEFYPKGTKILFQNGPPSEYLNVIKKGGVKVYVESENEGETIIDYRSEGEQFGFLSLVSGDRSRANVVAIEDTICYLIPKQNILSILQNNPRINQYFLKSFFINFIDKSYDETSKKYSGITENERQLFTTPVIDLVRREPVTAARNIAIKDAAAEMVKHKISSLVVVDADGKAVGMLTDRDFREKVVAKGLDVNTPISAIMSSSLVTVDAEEFCFEALLRMMRHKIHHILVLDNGKLKGMVTNHDFMVLQGASPTVLVKEIEKAACIKDLSTTVPKLCKSAQSLLRHGAKAHNITGFITELTDKVINSIIDMLEESLGPSPVPYTLFISGDGGRRELTLDMRLELGIVFDDMGDAESGSPVETYFKRLAKELNEALSSCYHRFTQDGGLLEGRIRSFSTWKDFFKAWRNIEKQSGIMPDFFEIRPLRGDGHRVLLLRDYLLEQAAHDKDLMDFLAAETVENRPPLGFFKKFVVEKTGEHKNELNIYQKGLKPLVDSVRIFALEKGCRDLSTMKRLRKLQQRFSIEKADDISQAFDYLLAVLIHNQLRQIEEGLGPDNFINPDTLSTLEKKTLKESFLLIAELYDGIENRYKTVRAA